MRASEWGELSRQRDNAIGELVDLDDAILADVGEVLLRSAHGPEHIDVDATRGFAQPEMLLER